MLDVVFIPWYQPFLLSPQEFLQCRRSRRLPAHPGRIQGEIMEKLGFWGINWVFLELFTEWGHSRRGKIPIKMEKEPLEHQDWDGWGEKIPIPISKNLHPIRANSREQIQENPTDELWKKRAFSRGGFGKTSGRTLMGRPSQRIPWFWDDADPHLCSTLSIGSRNSRFSRAAGFSLWMEKWRRRGCEDKEFPKLLGKLGKSKERDKWQGWSLGHSLEISDLNFNSNLTDNDGQKKLTNYH